MVPQFDKTKYLERVIGLKKVIFPTNRFSYQILLDPEYLNAAHRLNFLYEELECSNNEVISDHE